MLHAWSESHRMEGGLDGLPELLLIALFVIYIPAQPFFFTHLKNRERLRFHSQYSAGGNTEDISRKSHHVPELFNGTRAFGKTDTSSL